MPPRGGPQGVAVASTRRAVRLRVPTGVHDTHVAKQQLGHPVPGPHRIPTTVLSSTHQVTRSLLIDAGHRHPVTSSRRSNRAGCNATRWSVLTRSPLGRCNLLGSAT